MFTALASTFASVALATFLSFADPMSFEYSGQTDGSGTAMFIVKANQPLDDVVVTIQGDGKTIKKQVGSMKSGQQYKVTWKQSSGRAKYQLDVAGEGIEANFAFEIVKAAAKSGGGKLGQFKVRSSREDVVERNTAIFQPTFDLTSYEYKIYDSDGDVMDSQTVPEGVKAGEDLTIKWSTVGEVFMIFVRGEDEFGRFTEYKLVPWAVEIPHTEINFDSGKFNVKTDEAPKLDEALAVAFHELVALDKVNKAVGANLTPKLYIVGYTDTVGRAGSNEKLSKSRAKAIAEYFRDRGFWAEIYYAGMGERGLRVETGDNVDEVRNRRALYLLGVQQPAAGGQIPGRWAQLVGERSQPAGFVLPELPEKWKNYREERKAKNAGGSVDEGAGMGDALPEGGDDDGGLIGETGDETPAFDSGDEAPPAVEGSPGATSKGCSVSTDGTPAWGLLALFALGAVRRRD
ncbi:MAG: OmpA family protein [Myxococcota bacterium]